MLDIIPISLTYAAMAIDVLALFLFFAVIKRTRGGFRLSVIYLFIAVFFLLVRRVLNILDLSAIYNTGFLDDASAVIVAFFLLLSAISLFRDIRKLTDVKSNHRREMRFPRRKEASDRYVRVRIAGK